MNQELKLNVSQQLLVGFEPENTGAGSSQIRTDTYLFGSSTALFMYSFLSLLFFPLKLLLNQCLASLYAF